MQTILNEQQSEEGQQALSRRFSLVSRIIIKSREICRRNKQLKKKNRNKKKKKKKKASGSSGSSASSDIKSNVIGALDLNELNQIAVQSAAKEKKKKKKFRLFNIAHSFKFFRSRARRRNHKRSHSKTKKPPQQPLPMSLPLSPERNEESINSNSEIKEGSLVVLVLNEEDEEKKKKKRETEKEEYAADLSEKVDAIKGYMMTNICKLYERDYNIQDLGVKADELSRDTQNLNLATMRLPKKKPFGSLVSFTLKHKRKLLIISISSLVLSLLLISLPTQGMLRS